MYNRVVIIIIIIIIIITIIIIKYDGPRAVFKSVCCSHKLFKAVPLLSHLVGRLFRRKGSNPGQVYVRSVMDKVALGQVFSYTSVFPCQYNSINVRNWPLSRG